MNIYLESNIKAISSPKAILIAIHGLGTYGGWFTALAQQCIKDQILVYNPDLPGFGSNNINYTLDTVQHQDWIACIINKYQECRQQYPDIPVYILGHSMGGLLTLNLLVKHKQYNIQPEGIISTVPALCPNLFTFNPFEVYQSKTPLNFPPEVFQAITNKQIEKQYLTSSIPRNVYLEIMKLIINTWWNINNFNQSQALPSTAINLLILMSKLDKLVWNPPIKQFFNQLNMSDSHKLLYEYPKFGHDLFVIEEHSEINTQIINWIINSNETTLA